MPFESVASRAIRSNKFLPSLLPPMSYWIGPKLGPLAAFSAFDILYAPCPPDNSFTIMA
ncbi:hypothetical protein ACTHSF_12645 [Neisseria sp. P0001.S010]